MKIRLFTVSLCFIFLISFTTELLASPKVVVTEKDQSIFQEKLNRFLTHRNLPTGSLLLEIALDFRTTPYVDKTLDHNNSEQLVVNLREFDCTTFVESSLAIALTIKKPNPSFANYLAQLERIRYRYGILNGYESRLHYFSEWIIDNQQKGIVEDVTAKIGGVIHPMNINFMGSHPNSYAQLSANPGLINPIKEVEKKLSSSKFFFIPKEQLSSHLSEILDGDIIALTTRIAGLDVSHLGIAYKQNGSVWFLNASSLLGSVSITPKPLIGYLNDSKNCNGIFVIRAK